MKDRIGEGVLSYTMASVRPCVLRQHRPREKEREREREPVRHSISGRPTVDIRTCHILQRRSRTPSGTIRNVDNASFRFACLSIIECMAEVSDRSNVLAKRSILPILRAISFRWSDWPLRSRSAVSCYPRLSLFLRLNERPSCVQVLLADLCVHRKRII